MNAPLSLLAGTALASLLCPAAASAQTDAHPMADDGIIVTAAGLSRLDSLAGQSVVTGEVLLRDMRGQVGDSLTRQPGMSATSFSPGASRPVLRGFGGERVRVLTDGLGSLDASAMSADHAVTLDPLTAERIEVVRGPAVLLYGSSAIGGAVNIVDRPIPRAEPEAGVHGDVVASFGSAAEERGGGGAFDVAVGGGVVVHVDGGYRRTGDVRAGGYVLSPALRAEQIALAQEERDEGHDEAADDALAAASARGRVADSDTRTYTLGAGAVLLREGGSLGLSVGHYDSRYGVPTRPGGGHGHGGEEEGAQAGEGHVEPVPVSIAMRQTRVDVRGEIAPENGPFERVRVRAGYVHYTHTELEGDEVGTRFASDGFEGRVELVQSRRGAWHGVVGVQGLMRDFSADGEEAFVLPYSLSQGGLFTLQQAEWGPWAIEAGGRIERTGITQTRGATGKRRFTTLSGALGISHGVGRARIGLNLSHAERAPSAEELFADGPHIATQSYEQGDPALRAERSSGAEAYIRGAVGPVEIGLALYYNRFANFIYQAETGAVAGGLPVLAYRQDGAHHAGAEVNASAQVARVGGTALVLDMVADYVRATLVNGGGPVPRMPPARVLGGLEARAARLTGRVEVEYTAAQTRLAALETPSRAFTLVNAALTWRPWGAAREAALVLSVDNIFDVDARRHASLTRDFVPLPGRDARIALRMGF